MVGLEGPPKQEDNVKKAFEARQVVKRALNSPKKFFFLSYSPIDSYGQMKFNAEVNDGCS
jgi:hypothetical protein